MTTLSRLGRRLSLKPYGDELLTRSGDFWIFCARLIILTMALAEGLAWGYMGSLMSRSYPWVAAIIAGSFVFLLIWIVDATFITLDLSGASATREKARLTTAVLARVAIVTASLVITAPFLAQAIFAGDVRDEMSRRNSTTVASKRQQIEQPFVARLTELQRERKALEDERVREAAGVGRSGRYGRGPALETVERQLAEKVEEIRGLETARASALTRFDSLSRPQLEQQYGLAFVSLGVRSSSELLSDLLKSAQFRSAEVAVRAFLAFLFLGLLILKAFQPRSIAVYYNEQLHSIYDQYRKGLFDNYLPEPERVNIEPLRFEEWCAGTYAHIRKEDERRRETAREVRMHELLVEQWRGLERAARAELEPLMERYEATVAAIDELEKELHTATSSKSLASAELQKTEAACASMLRHLHAEADGAAFEHAVKASRELEERRLALACTVADNDRTIESCTKRLDVRRSDAASLRAEIATKQTVIADAEKRIGDERINLNAALAELHRPPRQ